MTAWLREHRWPMAVLLANTLVVYGPCLLEPTSVWAWPYTGYLGGAWLQWLFAEQLLSGELALATEMVAGPGGLSLVDEFADFGPSLVFAPLSMVLHPLLAFNLTMIGQYLLFGVCFYGFAHELLEDRVGAAAAAVVASHATAVLLPFWWGEPPLAMVWFLPAYFWGLRRVVWKAKLRPALWLGVTLGVSAFFCSYWFYFAGLFTGLVILWTRPWRFMRRLGKVVGWGVAAIGVFVALRIVLLPTKTSTLGDGAQDMDLLESWENLRTPPTERYSWSTSLDVGGVLTPKWGSRSYRDEEAARAEGAIYLGWIPLIACLVAVGRKRLPHAGLAALAGVSGLVLAAGPYVRYGNELLGEDAWTQDAGEVWPLPHLVLAPVLPGLARMNHPYRFALFPSFVLAVGLGAVVRRRPGLAVVLTVAAVAEHAWATDDLLPFTPTAIDVPDLLVELPEVPGRPAVLQVPGSVSSWAEGGMEWDRWHLAVQMLGHGRP